MNSFTHKMVIAATASLVFCHGAIQAQESTALEQIEPEQSTQITADSTTDAQPMTAEQQKIPDAEPPKDIDAPDDLPSDYKIAIRDIEQRVNRLKERIHQSKARLIQLQEVVLHGTISGAKAMLVHANEMGGSFRIERVQYSLDGSPIYNRVDQDGDLDQESEIVFFDGSIVPGNHQISVYVVIRGNGFGIFSYLNNYKFKVKSSFTFNAEEGKQTTIRIVNFEKGNITTELSERPSIRFDVERKRALRTDVKAPSEEAKEVKE